MRDDEVTLGGLGSASEANPLGDVDIPWELVPWTYETPSLMNSFRKSQSSRRSASLKVPAPATGFWRDPSRGPYGSDPEARK
jgi:hypothetical protein